MDCHVRDLPLICHRASKLRKIEQIPKMTVHKKLLINKKFSTKCDDLGVNTCIMGRRCSIQQGEKNNSWSEQSPEKSTVLTVPFFLGHPVYCQLYSCDDRASNEHVHVACYIVQCSWMLFSMKYLQMEETCPADLKEWLSSFCHS